MKWFARGRKGPDTGHFRAPAGLPALSAEDKGILDQFAALYYRLWQQGRGTIDAAWLGYKTLKCPLDLWIYQEILVETQPDWIVECGTRFGGSAYFLASLCETLSRGRVVTIDIETQSADIDGTVRSRPVHPRIDYVTGSSVDPNLVARVAAQFRASDRVMVILDSDHRCDHVLAELRSWSPFVTPGNYVIVEDTNINGHPALPEFGPGPWEAVEAFLAESRDFSADADRERFLMTLNPRGYLKRKT